jgi:POT family proton-dependent oligopeptide transporter
MAKSKYLTAPIPSEKMPAGIPYILTNEAAERFSFYGMSSILVVFMTKYLVDRSGSLDVMTDGKAKEYFHWFKFAVYFTPLLGALLSDIWLGKYRTILYFSLVYCVGYFAQVVDLTHLGLAAGLILISIGSGIIKPCVSANVGDQFGQSNKHLIERVYSWFYFSINLGATIAMFLCPWLLDRYGPKTGFGIPAILMVLATVVFWLGKYKFVHIPRGGTDSAKEAFSGENLVAIGKLCIIFLFIAMFWSLFDQSQSAWVLQAEKMNLKWLGIRWLPAQLQSINPFLIMVMIPVFSYAVYPALNKLFGLTPLRKIGIGLFVAVLSFVVPGWVESQIDGGDIFKCSSRSTITGLEPIRLLDGQADGTGWSSSKAPMVNEPIEIVIRLRERQAWTVSSIEINSATTISQAEIVATIDDLSLRALQEHKKLREKPAPSDSDLKTLTEKATILKDAARRAKKASDVKTAKAIAEKALGDVNESPLVLDDRAYYPKEISVFAGDFAGRLLPELISELEEKEKLKVKDPVEFARRGGWTHVGTFALPEDGSVRRFEFNPTSATHVLIQVNSNYGARRVKIAEVGVMTAEPIPVKSAQTAREVWPNLAGIGYRPPIFWQFIAYLILTAAEIMVSITALEFSYTQAPKKIKSFIMAIYLLSVSLGNAFTAVVNKVIQNPDGSSKLPGASYYWFFTIGMLVTAILFIPIAKRYRVKSYIQDEAPAETTS